ncbi:Endonuclease/exonuclease/phosphatase [Cercophora newfieldiana]|uniref:Endonuclease/exonuclease/phosphatase n=1 Tax=Cercophora newfieldiana TaxID=92897 RepID=A0AA40CW22_9PEZI|nr:Endonuclease/exonuclease/phosphatase [Cercophora newfieldiana]
MRGLKMIRSAQRHNTQCPLPASKPGLLPTVCGYKSSTFIGVFPRNTPTLSTKRRPVLPSHVTMQGLGKLPGIAQLFPQPRVPQPAEQFYYVFQGDHWEPVESGPSEAARMPDAFSVVSWNIDFQRPLENERMKAALDYLGKSSIRGGKTAIIMFNEMIASDLQLIQQEPWVREAYFVADLTGERWISRYGTCMLVPKSLPVKNVFRVPYLKSDMGRDVLFVDIALPGDKTLRVGSTHLESLRADPPRRPAQLQMAADFMKQADAAIVGGDLNAIEDFDKTLHLSNDLKDAYLETGGEEGAEEGATWGQMVTKMERLRYGLGRLDKILYCGELSAEGFRRFGIDAVLEGEAGERLVNDYFGGLEKPWVTDHMGIMADFKLRVTTFSAAGVESR